MMSLCIARVRNPLAKPSWWCFLLLLSAAGCAANTEMECDLLTCEGLCRGAGYVTGSCLGSDCHCTYETPGNSNWNPWQVPDAGDLCGGCSSGNMCCDGLCIGVESDPNNCGGCDRICPFGHQCANGWCRCGEHGPCIEGLERCCDGECVNVMYDPTHCGTCGNTCEPTTGPECIEGECVCPQPEVYGPPRACAGTYEDMCCDRTFLAMGGCFDLGNDREHCGSCENSCPVFEGSICILGACTDSLN